MNRRSTFPLFFGLLALGAIFTSGCASKRQPLEEFSESQNRRISEKTVYRQAELDFWAALYEPSEEDLHRFRTAWIEHSRSFPESKAIADIESEIQKDKGRVMVIALFMSDWDLADLKNRDRGWSVYPKPIEIKELTQDDVVLRTLMPTTNQWARYFMVRFDEHHFSVEGDATVVVGNRTSKAELSAKN